MSIAPDRLSPNQDEFYNTLMDAHAGLSEAESQALNARLILLMANRIGDVAVLQEIIDTARSYLDG
jgi:hypothetical protein